jgi:hypothetical protein
MINFVARSGRPPKPATIKTAARGLVRSAKGQLILIVGKAPQIDWVAERRAPTQAARRHRPRRGDRR